MKGKYIYNDTFNFGFDFYWSSKKEELNTFLKKNKYIPRDEMISDGFVHYCDEQDIAYIVLYLKTPDIIAHEALHAVVSLCNARGVEFVPQNEEVIAYLLGWIIREINLVLKKKESGKKTS